MVTEIKVNSMESTEGVRCAFQGALGGDVMGGRKDLPETDCFVS